MENQDFPEGTQTSNTAGTDHLPPTPTRDEFFLNEVGRVSADEISQAAESDSAPDGTTSCMLCMERYGEGQDEYPVRVPCGHWFGNVCLPQIFGNECPICRRRLFRREPAALDGDDLNFILTHDDDDGSDSASISSSDDEQEDDINLLPSTSAPRPWHQALIPEQLEELHNAAAQGRTRFERAAAASAGDLDFHRTFEGYQLHLHLSRIPRAADIPTPTHDGAARDTRPYAVIRAFEAITLREICGPSQWLHAGLWLTVHAEAIRANLATFFESMRPWWVLQRGPYYTLTAADTAFWIFTAVLTQSLTDWCHEHEGEFWRAEALRAEWMRIAREQRDQGAGHGMRAGTVEAMESLLCFVIQWRGVRELEVFGGLVQEGEEGEDEDDDASLVFDFED
ncbi:Zinc finger RING-type protein [Macrophomina phaseolina MS6]|uniref:Zinc finger RING-type protein n=1 Tax=Macrophomina phaseolina (strain MS6) TaxID=1126212 RepID=K2REI8_MACPH|nr:Zinc finger RING-type protein [Macrophomina phaseolina MS6]